MGTFDPSTFLDIQTKEANSTEYIPLDEGEYTGIVETVDVREWTSKRTPPSVAWPSTSCGMSMTKANARSCPATRSSASRASCWTSTPPGGLETGKGMNVNLGRLRESRWAQQARASRSASRMLVGQVARVSVKNRIDEGAIFSDIKSVTEGRLEQHSRVGRWLRYCGHRPNAPIMQQERDESR